MPEFHFHPELFDARARLIEALRRSDLLWFRDYPTLDVLHDEYGLEVCGVQEKETAIRIGWVMVETFPDWPYGSLFLKEWRTGDPGWKVIIAKRPDVEGYGFEAADGSRSAYLLRDVLRWPRHYEQERPGDEPAWRPEGDEDESLGNQGSEAEEGGMPGDGDGAGASDADEEEGVAEPEGGEAGSEQAASESFVQLRSESESGSGSENAAEVLDPDEIREFVEQTRRPDSGLGAWVATAWLEFVAIGSETVRRHREDHREVIEAAVRRLAADLMDVAEVGLWSPTEGVVFLPAARSESAHEATAALEKALAYLSRVLVVRGEHEVTGIRTRMTLKFARPGQGGATSAHKPPGASRRSGFDV